MSHVIVLGIDRELLVLQLQFYMYILAWNYFYTEFWYYEGGLKSFRPQHEDGSTCK